MEERLAHPHPEDSARSGFLTDAVSNVPASNQPVINIFSTASGVDEVLKKAMDAAQVSMKEAKEDHKSAVSMT